MSIKSFLQFLLLLLIFLIISAIYFVYFYSGPLKNENFLSKTLNIINKVKIDEVNISDQEILEDVIITNKENINKKNEELKKQNDYKNGDIKKDKVKDFSRKNKSEENKLKKDNPEKIKNLTKEIEYITSNKKGDIFKILAKYGQTNIDNSNILDLDVVDGLISSIKRSKIYIKSDHAKYNYNNQNSQFYSNVEIKYDDKVITCDNLDLQITKNYAIAYNNVKIQDSKSVLKAQMLTLNILTKDININSRNKLEIKPN
tara:strand:- start:1475 stop:2248 length:774 start_codon:yes stop_codon:yes gene_type:complete